MQHGLKVAVLDLLVVQERDVRIDDLVIQPSTLRQPQETVFLNHVILILNHVRGARKLLVITVVYYLDSSLKLRLEHKRFLLFNSVKVIQACALDFVFEFLSFIGRNLLECCLDLVVDEFKCLWRQVLLHHVSTILHLVLISMDTLDNVALRYDGTTSRNAIASIFSQTIDLLQILRLIYRLF